MNRLVIIGNGFDLAHGLPTSYKDFIDDYWSDINTTLFEDDFIKLNMDEIGNMDGIDSYSKLVDKLNNYFKKYGEEWKVKFEENEFFIYKPLNNNISKTSLLKFKNDFFRIICNNSIENWVDIENEYYEMLKSIVRKNVDKNKKKEKVVLLNTEFKQVKNLLEKYLKEKIETQYDFTLYSNNSVNKLLLPELTYPFDEKQYLKEFQYGDQSYIKEFLNKSIENYDLITHFLSFNYTKVVQQYFDGFVYPKQLNYIHGKLNEIINIVNFGFGDEMDDDYKTIENINDNEYLRNFKSFQYLQNPNYKSFLDLIDSDKFQVLIMGHSCGLSDRTLLNTIFEHKNCRSIKVFYHETKDEKGKVLKDNYTEIIQNISRHFNKKALMREKIVNKTLCQPLPQIQLPLK